MLGSGGTHTSVAGVGDPGEISIAQLVYLLAHCVTSGVGDMPHAAAQNENLQSGAEQALPTSTTEAHGETADVATEAGHPSEETQILAFLQMLARLVVTAQGMAEDPSVQRASVT